MGEELKPIDPKLAKKLREAFGKQEKIPLPGTREYVDYFFEKSEYVQPRPPVPAGGHDLRGNGTSKAVPPAQGS